MIPNALLAKIVRRPRRAGWGISKASFFVRVRPSLSAAPGFLCGTRCVRYARETSWFFALTSSFPVFPVSFRRRAKYTAGVSRSDVKIKIT